MSKIMKFTLFFFSLALSNAVSAGAVFDANCKSCHAGGGNIMDAKKTLSMADLKSNGVDTQAKIKALVSSGKAPMPGFKGTLDAAQIDSVSTYVLEQAKKGW